MEFLNFGIVVLILGGLAFFLTHEDRLPRLLSRKPKPIQMVFETRWPEARKKDERAGRLEWERQYFEILGMAWELKSALDPYGFRSYENREKVREALPDGIDIYESRRACYDEAQKALEAKARR